MNLQSFIKKLAFFSGFAILLTLAACGDKPDGPDPVPEKFIIKAADLSFLPEIEDAGVAFYNRGGQAEGMLKTLKDAGMNTVRIRLWKNPVTPHSGFTEVKAFSEKVRAMGLKVWITVHYSDTWADPGSQIIPAAWASLGYYAVKDSLYAYTSMIVNELNPDYIQIGNEINNGMMWPLGNLGFLSNLRGLLDSGAKAVRDNSSTCKIIIHYAGFEEAEDFYSQIAGVDFDVIGLSYYPMWHGKNLGLLETTLDSLGKKFDKQVLIAETAYPFTLGWNDWTNNVVGLEEHLVDGYPATPAGQKSFLQEIKRISTSAEKSIGFAYWGGEWVAYKGTQATNGSSYENQAFYDFENKALPVIDTYGDY
ncbi:MAG: glycosyl hydrolase 53 family protein [Bacteroidales bacterium]|nr:glycosyl hydrolase 53 family protein [Bacteroidales bacterium]